MIIIIIITTTIIEVIVIATTKIKVKKRKKKGVIRTVELNNMINLFVNLSLYSNLIILTNQLKFSVNKKCV